MADNGAFRTGIGGFNKADVLRYIDELNAAHAQELKQTADELEQEREEAFRQRQRLEESDAVLKQNAGQLADLLQNFSRQEETLADYARVRDELERSAGELAGLREENRMLKESLGGLRLLVDDASEAQERVKAMRAELDALKNGQDSETQALRQEAGALRGQLETARAQRLALDEELDALREQRDELAVRASGADSRVQELEQANRGYAEIIGDVGTFILELRSMGQRYLEECRIRAGVCLDAMDGAVTVLEQQLAASRRSVEEARRELEDGGAAAELRLQEWVRHLEKSAESVPEQAAPPMPDEPAEEAETPEADEAAHFFR